MDDAQSAGGSRSASAAGSTPSQRADELTRFWSITVPRRMESFAPRLADAFADGAWTAIWPKVSGYAPVAGLIIGFLVAVLLPLVPIVVSTGYEQTPRVWSELLPFIMLVIAAGILQGSVGIGLVAGYVVGDVLRLAVTGVLGQWSTWSYLGSNPLLAMVLLVSSALITYLLLAIPAITLPMIARRFAELAPLRRISNERARMAARIGAYTLAAGLLTFFWTRGVVVLIRPIFMWRNGSPTVEAIFPVQFQWEWLVATAVIAVLVRLVLQAAAVRRSSAVRLIGGLQAERWADANPGAFWQGAGPIPRIALVAATATLLLAGTYGDLIDPVLVFLVAALATAWRSGMIRPNAAWAQTVQRIPALGRLVIAGLLGYAMARIVVEVTWATTNSLRPILIGILLIGAVFVALFPTMTRPSVRSGAAKPA